MAEMVKLSAEHRFLQPLLDEYGPVVVTVACLRMLGYPPSWIESLNELLTLQDHLKGKQ